MTRDPLKTYLRTHRRRTALSQDDVAFLLGSISASTVCRHERGDRIPLLPTVLGYAFIYRGDVPALYEGVYRDVQVAICKRARGLHRSLERKPASSIRDQKIALLAELVRDFDSGFDK